MNQNLIKFIKKKKKSNKYKYKPPWLIIISEILLSLSLSLELNEISEIVNIPPEEQLNNGISIFVPYETEIWTLKKYIYI
jgi:hypothetical protein